MEPNPLTQTFELISKAQSGDDGALNRLFDRYYPRVLRDVRVRVGAKLRAREDLDDFVQWTFAKAAEKFDDFEMREEAGLIHWFAKIAENQIRDRADYHGAQKRDSGPMRSLDRGADGNTGRIEKADTTRGSPERRAQLDEEQRRLERALDGLQPELRELILLRDYEGFSWAEVAERTGHPSPDAARQKHAKAMRILAQRMAELGGDTG